MDKMLHQKVVEAVVFRMHGAGGGHKAVPKLHRIIGALMPSIAAKDAISGPHG